MAEALPYAMAQMLPLMVWMTTLALAVWGLVRLRSPTGRVLAAAIVATLALLLVYGEAAVAVVWVASLALVLSGFALLRRPGATTTIVFVAAWTIATWTNWGWEVLYEETGACVFPGVIIVPEPWSLGEVRCGQPSWTRGSNRYRSSTPQQTFIRWMTLGVRSLGVRCSIRGLCTEVRGRGIPRTSPKRSSEKFGYRSGVLRGKAFGREDWRHRLGSKPQRVYTPSVRAPLLVGECRTGGHVWAAGGTEAPESTGSGEIAQEARGCE